ncbi:hypothetical protein [Thioclava sediminum]|uniref:hypothetical protein n=1 Tax=Thioclava sediminum TaxID=1915319 RepID=UPI0011BA8F32|nr:hypothetical protein [Thioclava sediminum]
MKKLREIDGTTPLAGERLSLDRRDVALWLAVRYADVTHHLSVSRNYTTPPRVLAYVVVLTLDASREIRHKLRADALRAFEALGYTLAPTGGDVYELWIEVTSGMTEERRLACVERVEAALAGRVIPNPLNLRDYASSATSKDDF